MADTTAPYAVEDLDAVWLVWNGATLAHVCVSQDDADAAHEVLYVAASDDDVPNIVVERREVTR